MGCLQSKVRPAKERRFTASSGKTGKGYAAYILKIPKVRTAFRQLDMVFKEVTGCGNHTKAATEDQVRTMLEKLGATEIDKAEMDRIMSRADLDHTHALTFKQFIIAAAVEIYLNPDFPEEKRTKDFAEVQSGYKVIEDMFKKIDTDGDGAVDLDELHEALSEFATNKETAAQRMKELDLSNQKKVSLQEFIYGFCAWVGWEENESGEPMSPGILSPARVLVQMDEK